MSFFHFAVANKSSIKFSIYFQIFTDIITITGLVYFTGGVSSPFYFLYFLPIIVSAIFLSRRDTIYTAGVSYIIFGIISDLMYMKVLKFYPGLFDFEISNEKFIYNLIVSFIAFTFFAIISSYYFENMRKKGIELKSIRENLKDLILINNMVLERMENGLIISDSQGKIISYNEKAKMLLKLRGNTNILKLLDIKSIDELRKKISESDNRYVIELKRNRFVLEISISIIKEIYDFKEVFVLLVSNLTNKIAIEQELKKKEHFALIGEMSAGLAHEIRNPLASISGSIQYLHKELDLDHDARNLMEIIIKESARLSDSIEEFLQFTKSSPVEKEEFDLGKMINEIIEIVSFNNRKVVFKKRYGIGNIVKADRKKINQVVWNIINNGIKAVNSNGIIEINIYDEDKIIVLSVEDNGTGMNKEDVNRIFVPFFSKFTSGIGLGMAIVKRVLDEHGFKIEIITEINKGTEVKVWFK